MTTDPKTPDEALEEAAKLLDDNAQWLNQHGDPGMANHDRAMARKVRALKSTPLNAGGPNVR